VLSELSSSLTGCSAAKESADCFGLKRTGFFSPIPIGGGSSSGIFVSFFAFIERFTDIDIQELL
jgi:hypothetical protein